MTGLLSKITCTGRQILASYRGLTFSNENKIEKVKVPGTTIILSGYSHQLEIRTVLPSFIAYSKQTNFGLLASPVSSDLKMNVSPDKVQRFITCVGTQTYFAGNEVNSGIFSYFSPSGIQCQKTCSKAYEKALTENGVKD